MRNLPFLPISLSELLESDGFLHGDARVVRALIHMRNAAWNSPLPGSLPSGFEKLAQACRLTPAEVETHYAILTQGWSLESDGRLHHPQLKALAESLEDRFGAQLDVYADAAALACQGGDAVFDLVAPDAVEKKAVKRAKMGKSALPKDFVMDVATVGNVIQAGYKTQEQRDWLLGRFMDYALSRDVRQKNWQAALRTFAASSITARDFQARFGCMPGELIREGGVLGDASPAARLRGLIPGSSRASFATQSAERNSSLMAGAVDRFTGMISP